MTMLSYLFWTVLSFFSGSVMYSYLIPKLLYKKDITQLSDDHNPGCGNVFTLIGIPCGILCLVLELAKGALPVWLALRYVSAKNIMFAGILAAPVLGHAFSPMLRNRGGKAIAVTFGVLIGLCSRSPLLFVLAAALVIFPPYCASLRTVCGSRSATPLCLPAHFLLNRIFRYCLARLLSRSLSFIGI